MLYGLDLAQLAPRINCMVRLLLLLLIFWGSFASPGSCQNPNKNEVNDYRRRLWELFHRLDHDGDGKLQPDDLRKYPRLRSLDQNGDGQVLIKDLPSLNDGPLGERIQLLGSQIAMVITSWMLKKQKACPGFILDLKCLIKT